jgi:hypothetical protein
MRIQNVIPISIEETPSDGSSGFFFCTLLLMSAISISQVGISLSLLLGPMLTSKQHFQNHSYQVAKQGHHKWPLV